VSSESFTAFFWTVVSYVSLFRLWVVGCRLWAQAYEKFGLRIHKSAPTAYSLQPTALFLLTVLATFCTLSAAAQATAPAASAETGFAPLANKSVPEQVAKGMTFSEYEKHVLSGVRDRSTQPGDADAALPIMIARVASIGPLDKADYHRVEPIRVATLRDHPESFRYHPILANLNVYRARQVTGRGLKAVQNPDTGDLYVSDALPVWELFATDRAAGNDADRSPVFVYTTINPMPLLGRPDDVKDGWSSFFEPRTLQGTAIFYRVRAAMGTDGNVHDTPVIILWQAGVPKSPIPWPTIIIGIVIVAGFALWLSARRGLRRRAPIHFTAPSAPSAPVAGECDAVDPELRRAVEDFKQAKGLPPTPPADGPVDPALRQAVEDWKKEKRPPNDDPSNPR